MRGPQFQIFVRHKSNVRVWRQALDLERSERVGDVEARIYNFVLIRENASQQKPVLLHILCSGCCFIILSVDWCFYYEIMFLTSIEIWRQTLTFDLWRTKIWKWGIITTVIKRKTRVSKKPHSFIFYTVSSFKMYHPEVLNCRGSLLKIDHDKEFDKRG